MEVVKVGGSVYEEIPALIQSLKNTGKSILIVPGGWIFADLVREIDKKYKLKKEISHWMAITCMDIYGYFISNFDVKAVIPKSFSELENVDGINVVLPYFILKNDYAFHKIPASWDVTSDSISVWLAAKMGVGRVIKVTNVDGIFIKGELVKTISASDLIEFEAETCVDKFAPMLLRRYKVNMFVCKVEEVKNYILKGKAKGTLIKGE